MRLFSIASLVIVTAVIVLFVVHRRSEKVALALQTSEDVYTNYCVGCHNTQKSSFMARKWLFGGEREDIFKSIKYGRVSYGMPAFADGFKDDEIYGLADYILSISNQQADGVETTHLNTSGIEKSDVQTFQIETVVSGLEVPWGLEFLPNGDLLISERSGDLLIYSADGQLTKVENVPPVFAKGQGGLLDLELHPDYTENGWIYFSYSRPNEADNTIANTAIMRARLDGNRLTNNELIYTAQPETDKSYHFGCKLEFDQEGYLYFSVGDRGNRDRNPQTLDNDCGKIHRIHDDGRIPEDNPFVGVPNAKASIYSYGHRNPQGVCMHPETGRIWTDEHGPKGGDEINLITKGKNYGWPVISFGINYNGTTFTNDTAKVGMEQPILYWVPSIAPCGMTFVKGDRYPNWKNNILTGSLRFGYLHRVVLEGEKVIHQEKLLEGIGRVRNVEMSPDGYVYVAVEKPGQIIRLIPQ